MINIHHKVLLYKSQKADLRNKCQFIPFFAFCDIKYTVSDHPVPQQ